MEWLPWVGLGLVLLAVVSYLVLLFFWEWSWNSWCEDCNPGKDRDEVKPHRVWRLAD